LLDRATPPSDESRPPSHCATIFLSPTGDRQDGVGVESFVAGVALVKSR
jgi:hypothetical protein